MFKPRQPFSHSKFPLQAVPESENGFKYLEGQSFDEEKRRHYLANKKRPQILWMLKVLPH